MSRQHSRRTFLALGGSAAVAAVAAACTRGSGSGGTATTAGSSSGSSAAGSSTAPTSPSATPSPTPKLTTAVHVSLLNGDGDVRGVGMPIIAFVDQPITDAKAFNAATVVTVNGAPVEGNWYWQETARGDGSVYEAHWRPEKYWPAHAKIHMDLPVANVLAGADTTAGGGNFYFDNSLTLDMSTGVAYIGTVDAASHQMTVTADGAAFGTYPVSLGAPDTPTARGIKVIMEKGLDIRMSGPGYDDPHVKFTQRLTYGGEYLHSAPWNVGNIGQRSTSNGCTNLLPANAETLYNTFEIGDVFVYPNADGPAMTVGAGYGDWNLPWAQWQAGGLFKPA